jgi:N6-L-threonylcarbamoyladenine synthase
MTQFTPPLVLGIETSCDDTACALVDGEGRVVTSVVSSQLEAHRPWGGVVPEIASREHLQNWPLVSGQALEQAGVDLGAVHAVAATRGPGLVGSLLVGLSLGKAIAYGLGRPFYAVHHLEGHLFSPFLRVDEGAAEAPPDEMVGLVVSGGHTLLVEVADGGARLRTLAETRDDAMGEVFDKVGKRIGLDFPGGPEVDRLAERGNAAAHVMPVPSCGPESLDFSYSGLKSRALRDLDKLAAQGRATEVQDDGDAEPHLLDLLAGFRAAAVAQLVDRVARLHRRRTLRTLAVSGGAAANRLLRRELTAWAEAEGVDLRLVPLVYSGDNAAMIAHAALLRHRRGDADDPLDMDAVSRTPLER